MYPYLHSYADCYVCFTPAVPLLHSYISISYARMYSSTLGYGVNTPGSIRLGLPSPSYTVVLSSSSLQADRISILLLTNSLFHPSVYAFFFFLLVRLGTENGSHKPESRNSSHRQSLKTTVIQPHWHQALTPPISITCPHPFPPLPEFPPSNPSADT